MNTPEKLTREEWQRRYAERLMVYGGMDEVPAIASAKEATELGWENWSPKDAADEEMSYWEEE